MIDIQQLTSLISAFRVETEKESISPETVGSLLQAIADLLATATSETEYNVLRFWKDTISQFQFLYDIQQRNVSDHSNVILALMGRRMASGETFSLTLPIGPASRNQAGVMTAEDYMLLHDGNDSIGNISDTLIELMDTQDAQALQLNAIRNGGFVIQFFQAGSGAADRVTFSASRHNLATGGAVMTPNALVIEAATDQKAGVMTVAQVNMLNTAKTDINALKSAVNIIKGSGALVDGLRQYISAADRLGFQVIGYNVATGEQDVVLQNLIFYGATTATAGLMTAAQVNLLNQLKQAVLGSGGTAQSRSFFNIGIEIRRGADALHLRGASALVTMGYTPYLFRYTRKRNRVNIDHDKAHGPVRKGWNVLGKADTVSIGDDDTVLIDARVIQRDAYTDDQKYRHEARYFVKDALDRNGNRRASYGKIRITVSERQGKIDVPRKVRLLYGIAFAKTSIGNRKLLDKGDLVTPIVPFHVSTNIREGSYTWIFEK
ncbi:MAG: hypothetical protein IKW85_11195 [Muribaculaceae bacterium]|nr:hypothetical protein [Muribaculaceae bacterium]